MLRSYKLGVSNFDVFARDVFLSFVHSFRSLEKLTIVWSQAEPKCAFVHANNVFSLVCATRACSGAINLGYQPSMYLLEMYFSVLLVRFGVWRNERLGGRKPTTTKMRFCACK